MLPLWLYPRIFVMALVFVLGIPLAPKGGVFGDYYMRISLFIPALKFMVDAAKMTSEERHKLIEDLDKL